MFFEFLTPPLENPTFWPNFAGLPPTLESRSSDPPHPTRGTLAITGIEHSIESNQLSCEECQQRLKKCNTVVDYEEPYFIFNEYSFARNYKINGIINELIIKCDFEFNGCPQKVQVGQLVQHLKVCPNRFCNICGFIAGPVSQHNCFELMKSDRNEWKRIAIKAEKENKRLKNRIVLQEEDAYRDIQGESLHL